MFWSSWRSVVRLLCPRRNEYVYGYRGFRCCCFTRVVLCRMPLDGRATFQLGLLLLAVPAQYFITYYIPTNEASRSHAIHKIITGAVGLKDQYLSWQSWHKWCVDIFKKVRTLQSGSMVSDGPADESPAIEVLKYREPKGYFAGSTDPRSPRPPEVKYRIGQVIKHKRWGYRGVIVGWDKVAKAPEPWLKQMHPSNKLNWRKQPNYSILVDTRDRLQVQTTYIPQENIEILTNVQVIHPDIDSFFEAFDGAQYLPRPWMKKIYPHDH